MQVLCGQCGHTLDVDDSQGGSTLTCSRCEHQILVPRFDEGPPGEVPPEDYLPGEAEEEGFAGQVKEAMARKIHVVCGSCGRGLTVSARSAGKKARCPGCSAQILIPYPDEEEVNAELERVSTVEELPEGFESVPGRPELTEQLDLLGKAAEVGAAVPITRWHAPQRKTNVASWLILAGIALGVVVTGLWTTRRFWSPPPAKAPEEETGETGIPGKTRPGIGPGVSQGPELPTKSTQPQAPPIAATGPAKPPSLAGHKQQVVATAVDDFATGGYFPARPGMVYWNVTVTLKAGSEALQVLTYGRDVVLYVDDRPYESLGVQADQAGLVLRGERRNVILYPGQAQTFTFLFEVPADKQRGKLKVGPIGEATVELASTAVPPPAGALAGAYEEASPRNLKPLLRNPVMAAIQSTPDQELIERPNGETLDVSIPSAGVTGTARLAPDGMYKAVLKHQADELKCQLRPRHDGSGVILYLADEPFHQLTYVKSTGARKPAPEPPAPAEPSPAKPRPSRHTRPSAESAPAPPGADPPKEPTTRSVLPTDTGRKTIFD